METFIRFLFEFLDIFINAFKMMWEGIKEIFSFSKYSNLIDTYSKNFNGPEWIFTAVVVGFFILFAGLIIFLIFITIRRKARNMTTNLSNESLLEEIDALDSQVRRLMDENSKLMAMRVSQLGLNPNDDAEDPNKVKNPDAEDGEETDEEEEIDLETAHRFPKLEEIDQRYAGTSIENYNNSFTLEELIDNLRCFSASKLGLFYEPDLLRVFVSGLGISRLIILQGISGTGKTSLAYAWGKFVSNDSCVASVQPSWKDKTEFFGYFNEFTKKFTETDALGEIYKSRYDDNVHTVILDEMNIARVEYYFAEMLSILEIPNEDEWFIELVTSGWPTDPKFIDKGKVKIPNNLWYIGTINNDDSTYMVTDKVYDRAMPIDINKKIAPFKCREQEPWQINSRYLVKLFEEAKKNVKMSDEALEKLEMIDDYVVSHFRVAFGNRIMKQLKQFCPIYMACGGGEMEAMDYFIARKILRKFEMLNTILIRDELEPFISFLNKTCGKDVMKECIEFVTLLKKSI